MCVRNSEIAAVIVFCILPVLSQVHTLPWRWTQQIPIKLLCLLKYMISQPRRLLHASLFNAMKTFYQYIQSNFSIVRIHAIHETLLLLTGTHNVQKWCKDILLNSVSKDVVKYIKIWNWHLKLFVWQYFFTFFHIYNGKLPNYYICCVCVCVCVTTQEWLYRLLRNLSFY